MDETWIALLLYLLPCNETIPMAHKGGRRREEGSGGGSYRCPFHDKLKSGDRLKATISFI